MGNHLDLVRVCPRDPKLKQEKDRIFAKVAFGTDDPRVIEQNDQLVSRTSKTSTLKSNSEAMYPASHPHITCPMNSVLSEIG